MSAPVSRNSSLSRTWEEKTPKEKAGDISASAIEILASAYVATACYQTVNQMGSNAEESMRKLMEKPITFIDPSGMQLIFAPENVISTDLVIKAVQACSRSGSYAAAGVGIVETVYQFYRYYNSDDKRSWGVDLLEGGYRGAAVGAGVAFGVELLTNKSDATWGKVLGMATGTLIVGSILGTGLAGLGHVVRAIHVPNRVLPPEDSSPSVRRRDPPNH